MGKITKTFHDSNGVIRTVEVEEECQKSIRSIAFIVLLELDCETEAIPQAEEWNIDTEEGNFTRLPQSPIPSNIENRELENESADLQPALSEMSYTPNIEVDDLQHSDIQHELTQALSPELNPIEATPAEPSTLKSPR